MTDFFKKINSKENICRSCIYSRKKNNKLYCKLTQKQPDFHTFCPSFKLFRTRDDKIHENHIHQSNLYRYLFYLLFFSLLLVNAGVDTGLILGIMINILIFFSFLLQKIPKTVLKINWYPYLFFTAAAYTLNTKKELYDEEFQTLKQQIIKNFGAQGIKYMNEILQDKDKNLLAEIKKYGKKLNANQKLTILANSAELFFIYNTKEKYPETLIKLAKALEIPSEVYKKIFDFYHTKEAEYQEKIRKEKEEKQKNKKYYQNYKKVFTTKTEIYYQRLNLPTSATEKQIKKRFKELALKYHPDRYINKSEKEKELAAEKFKAISEAYNYLRRLKGF